MIPHPYQRTYPYSRETPQNEQSDKYGRTEMDVSRPIPQIEASSRWLEEAKFPNL